MSEEDLYLDDSLLHDSRDMPDLYDKGVLHWITKRGDEILVQELTTAQLTSALDTVDRLITFEIDDIKREYLETWNYILQQEQEKRNLN